jgi:RNA polymerase sigma factor (sigma-70 family)
MARRSLAGVLDFVRSLVGTGQADCCDDASLLRRFAIQRDEAAFVALVQRHGPLVLSVCRQVLRDPHAAEDAFQVTFLVLARKAACIRSRESLAAWLHRVAYRAALKAKIASARRQAHERETITMKSCAAAPELPAEWQPLLHEEVNRLPEKYRVPVVLCYLQGNTNEEAAHQLGWPIGTVKGRLARAREMLQRRLVRRGLALSAGAFAAAAAPAAIPAALLERAVRAACISTGWSPAPALAALAQEVLRDMLVGRLRLAAALMLAVCVAGVGAAALVHHGIENGRPAVPTFADGAEQAADAPARPLAPLPRTDLYGDPLPPGALARMGRVPRFWVGSQAEHIAFSPDGSMVACVGRGAIRLWDAKTGMETHRLKIRRPRERRVQGAPRAVFAPNGKVLATSTEGMTDLWEVPTGKELRQLDHTLCVLAFSPDGSTLVIERRMAAENPPVGQQAPRPAKRLEKVFPPPDRTGQVHNEIVLCDVESGKVLRTLVAVEGYSHNQTGSGKWVHFPPEPGKHKAAFSPDGKLLALACDAAFHSGSRLRVFDLQSGKEIPPQSLRSPLDGLAFFSAGKALVWKTPQQVGFSAALGVEELKSLMPPKELGKVIGWSDSGKILYLSADDKTAHLWDWGTGKRLGTVSVDVVRLGMATAISPDGKLLLHRDPRGGALAVWDVGTGQERDIPSYAAVDAMAFTPDGKALISGSSIHDQAIHFWDVGSGKEKRSLPRKGVLLTVSPDGQTLVQAPRPDAADAAGPVLLRDAATGQERRRIAQPDLTSYTKWASFSPDGKTLAILQLTNPRNWAGSQRPPSYSIRFWDVEAGREKHMLQGKDDYVISVVFSPDGRTVAASRIGGEVTLHELATGQVRGRFPSPVPFVGFSPDGKTLASAAPLWQASPGVRLWDLATDKDRLSIPQSGQRIAFSPDGKTLAALSGEAGLIELWDTATGKGRGRFHGHQDMIQALVFSPDGSRLASACADNTILEWDLTSLEREPVAPGDRVPSARLTAQETDALWAGLRDTDAVRAYKSLHALAAVPAQTLPFLRQDLKPAAADGPKLPQLIADLDDKQFAVRQKAAQELEKLGQAAEPALRRCLEGKPSLEVRQRVELLLAKIRPGILPPDELRTLRAVETLELIGTAPARQLLEALAKGAPEARLTLEAKASLERMARRAR